MRSLSERSEQDHEQALPVPPRLEDVNRAAWRRPRRAARSSVRSPEFLLDPAELIDPATLRPQGGAMGELHAHSIPRSRDSGVHPDALAAQAVWRGLDLVVLTEHNTLWPAAELHALSERHEITVLAGMELGTDLGHILVFGLDHYSPELLFIDGLRPIVQSEGAAMVLAHPMRPLSSGRKPGWDEIAERFDGLEVVNGDHGEGANGYYRRLAAELGVAAVGGSDVHSREAVGRVATAFPEPVTDIETLVRLLHECRVHPVDLRPQICTTP